MTGIAARLVTGCCADVICFDYRDQITYRKMRQLPPGRMCQGIVQADVRSHFNALCGLRTLTFTPSVPAPPLRRAARSKTRKRASLRYLEPADSVDDPGLPACTRDCSH